MRGLAVKDEKEPVAVALEFQVQVTEPEFRRIPQTMDYDARMRSLKCDAAPESASPKRRARESSFSKTATAGATSRNHVKGNPRIRHRMRWVARASPKFNHLIARVRLATSCHCTQPALARCVGGVARGGPVISNVQQSSAGAAAAWAR